MSTTVVRYQVKEGRGDENQALVEAVFAELAQTKPEGLSYGTVRLDDGVTFIHTARIDGEENPLANNRAFKAFTDNIAERCDVPPAPAGATVIGNYCLYDD
ncbi:MAG: hypothetical protein GY724_02170 [Actinomycetia bacterium]|nr:hypothetical protein [Actinomycetes bacterium]MCP4228096.1 hypothetical protein [Actinomycetes bacterium]MCP5035519.1 hypothetical protein [Actinomycetes bacterium]